MKMTAQQKKYAMIGGGILVGLWVLYSLTRKREPEAISIDNGAGEAGYATYNQPYVVGSPASGGYTFGDIIIGNTQPVTPAGATTCACNDPCSTSSNSSPEQYAYVSPFSYFGAPPASKSNYTPPLKPYINAIYSPLLH